jgi:hypothetical protein
MAAVRASYLAAAAFLLLIAGRWAHDKPALNIQTVAGGAFVIIVIAALDNGATEEIAKGIAWLLLAAVALSADSPLTAIAAAATAKATGSATVTASQKAIGAGGPNA